MNKSLYLIPIFVILFIFTCGFRVWAQCPSGEIVFTSQQEVDDFAVNYPNCTAGVYLYIGDNSITDINDLSPLTQVVAIAQLIINNNPQLTSLSGLENVFFNAGDIMITNNANLTDISALSGVEYLQGTLEVINNPSLSSLNGLENINDEVKSIIIENNPLLGSLANWQNVTDLSVLSIISNDALVDLSGLNNLNSVEYIYIKENYILNTLNGLEGLDIVDGIDISSNPNLMSLSGLENLGGVVNLAIKDNDALEDISSISNFNHNAFDYLSIANNPNLSTCNIESICNYLAIGDNAYITNNLTDCAYTEIVYTNCGFAFPTCPISREVRLYTQDDVDLFLVRFPNCTELQNVIIDSRDASSPISDLSPLNQIQTIHGDLTIQNNSNLTNLAGLESLTSTNTLRIANNDALSDLNALPNLTNIRYINIGGNEILDNLNGLEYIDYTQILNVSISFNPNLSTCYIESICSYIGNDGLAWFFNNADGCRSRSEVQSTCFPLPVELTHFNAQVQRGSILLKWQTATETNNQGFDIQRSKDGINWEKIGYQQGAINSNTTQDYRHNDTQPLSGINYYRLKQIDVEGDFIYSDVVSVSYGNKGFAVFPVPAKEEITLQIESPETTIGIRISNIIGEVIHTQDLQLSEGVNQLTFDISDYTNGVYFLTISNGDKNGTQRFVKH